MGGGPMGPGDWPVAVWIVLLGVVAFLGQYAVLRWRWGVARAQGAQAERRLVEAASRLRDYATANLQRLPESWEQAGWIPDAPIAYRPIPRLALDERLILVHDARPTHQILEFPSLREGRGVVLCNGRMLVVTESAFEKLMEADNALRQRLGLEAIAEQGPMSAGAGPAEPADRAEPDGREPESGA